MKRSFSIVVLFISLTYSDLTAGSVLRSTQTTSLGVFGGIGFGYSEPASKETLELNVQGGIVYNHWLTGGISLDAFFMINPLDDNRIKGDARLIGAYGGLFCAPVIYSNSLVHLGFPVFIGYGTVNYELFNMEQSSSFVEDSDQYWVFKPGLEVEVNILSFIRIAVGGYYRLSSGISLRYKEDNKHILDKNVMNGFTVGLKLRFGKF